MRSSRIIGIATISSTDHASRGGDTRRIGVLCAFLAFLLVNTSYASAASDSTIVTFQRASIDLLNRTATGRFVFPESSEGYGRIVMIYTIECAPRGCDPWDRVSTITVRRPADAGEELIEIARFITPPARGGSWIVDVTDYAPLLRDTVMLSNYIPSGVGGGQGMLVTVIFRFIAGPADIVPSRVENLWNGLPVYGDPERPIDEFLQPIGRRGEAGADFFKIRATVTGHGEGNTDGAATYARKLHEIALGDTVFTRHLWRDDCAELPGTPDDERWKRPRAGYCLGDLVRPWEIDVSPFVAPGGLYTADYNVEPYVNECRPGADPCPCSDCSYRAVGHDEPFYWMESQIISYRIVGKEEGERRVRVEPGTKSGEYIVTPLLDASSPAEIRVVDLFGNDVFRQMADDGRNRTFRLDLSSTPGVYLLKVISRDGTFRRRLEVR